MPRKLKVVNLEPKQEENNDIAVVNEIVVEDVKEEIKTAASQETPIVSLEQTYESTPNNEVKEEVKHEVKEEVTQEQTPKQKVKISNLVACPRCGRYMKQNTLDFHHDKVCKSRSEEFIPKALKNTKLKAENIKHIVKEAMDIIEKERPKKIEKVETSIKEAESIHVTKPIEKAPERVSSVPPVRKLSPIQERPLYNDLRRERMEKKINTINSLKLF